MSNHPHVVLTVEPGETLNAVLARLGLDPIAMLFDPGPADPWRGMRSDGKATHTSTPVRLRQDVQDARLATCREGTGLSPDQIRDGHCDRYKPDTGKCQACGCAAGVEQRAASPWGACPLGRWAE